MSFVIESGIGIESDDDSRIDDDESVESEELVGKRVERAPPKRQTSRQIGFTGCWTLRRR